MSYTPTEWQTGDTITAEKLNNMESGIANNDNTFVVHYTPSRPFSESQLDKTAAETYAAIQAGKNVVILCNGFPMRAIPSYIPIIATWIIPRSDGLTSINVSLRNNSISAETAQWDTQVDISYPNLDLSFYTLEIPNYQVIAFDHTDPYPYFQDVGYNVDISDTLDQLINSAYSLADASAEKKSALSMPFQGDMAEIVFGVARSYYNYFYHGRPGMLLLTSGAISPVWGLASAIYESLQDRYSCMLIGHVVTDSGFAKYTLCVTGEHYETGENPEVYDVYEASVSVECEIITPTSVS